MDKKLFEFRGAVELDRGDDFRDVPIYGCVLAKDEAEADMLVRGSLPDNQTAVSIKFEVMREPVYFA